MVELFPANGFRVKTPFWSVPQKRVFDRSWDKPNFFLQHEPRCGKSLPVVVTCDYHHSHPESPLHVKGAIIVAWPNGAHVGWVLDAFPQGFGGRWRGMFWNSQKAGQVGYQREFDNLLKYKGFRVLSLNAESLISDETKKAVAEFCRACGRVMAVADEISFMADENTRRAKTMFSLGGSSHVVMKRALDGTPVGRHGPLDAYAEYGWLDFAILGYANRVEYNAHYAEYKTQGRAPFWAKVKEIRERILKEAPGLSPKVAQERAIERAKGSLVEEGGKKRKLVRGRDWWRVLAEDEHGMPLFKNMDEYWRRTEPVTDRATFAECFPHAKRPVFVKRYFELTAEQRRVYDALEEEHRAQLSDGTEIDAAHHLSRILRLQQVASGFYPDSDRIALHVSCAGLGCEACDGTGTIETPGAVKVIGDRNPRMEAYADVLREGCHIIAWARFDRDVDECMRIAKELGFTPAQYDGRVSNADKLANRLAFQERKVNPLVCKPTSASRGIPLHAAEAHVMVSNIYSFRTRRQMEERSEHGSKTHVATSIIDLVGVGTVDETHIIPALRQGMDVSTFVLRDARREWL